MDVDVFIPAVERNFVVCVDGVEMYVVACNAVIEKNVVVLIPVVELIIVVCRTGVEITVLV